MSNHLPAPACADSTQGSRSGAACPEGPAQAPLRKLSQKPEATRRRRWYAENLQHGREATRYAMRRLRLRDAMLAACARCGVQLELKGAHE